MEYNVTTFYKFIPLLESRIQELEELLCLWAKEHKVYGLIIIGNEGINATIAAAKDGILCFKQSLASEQEFSDLIYKDSKVKGKPFKRFKVKIRNEIVTLGEPEIKPEGYNNHLSPSDWNRLIKEENDYVLIDTRNDYETELGMFKDAIDPKISMFNEFPDFIEKSNIPKDKKILMYCTGGIRCEKAAIEMQQQGYENVYQLEGGILKYLEEFPDSEFHGECFVFDHRVAVDQNLTASKHFHLCPHCGNPGSLQLECIQCKETAKICSRCADRDEKYKTCSKNCAHHASRNNTAIRVSNS